MHKLVSAALQYPVTILMLFVGVILLGVIALERLPTNLFPDIAMPRITVVVDTDGLSPEEVERRISRPLERSIATLRNVRSVQSISRADQSVVTVDFDWDTDLDYAFLDVKKAVGDLREETRSTNIFRFDPNALPILTLALLGEANPVDLRQWGEKTLKPSLERIDGVAQVEVSGGLDSEVRVQVNPELLIAYGIDYNSLPASIRNANVNSSGGWIEDRNRRYVVRALGEYQRLADIGATVVGYQGNVPVTLADVAESITLSARNRANLVRYNGRPAVGLAVFKEPDANTVLSVRKVREALVQLVPADSTRFKIEVAYDQSSFINAAIGEVKSAALWGILWATLVLFLFLRRLAPTLIIFVAIPLSIVATFNLMYFSGLSLNIMTLGGLALGAGMLVDNAIVVIENMFRRRQAGDDAATAARLGTSEVAGAILSATLTTVVVFFPIVYVHGFTGLLFREQALTVCFSLLASLAAAVLLIPVLGARYLRARRVARHRLSEWYGRALALVLRPTGQLAVVAALAAALAWSIWTLPRIPRELVPDADQGQFVARLTMPLGSSLEVTDEAVRRLEGRLEELGDTVQMYYTRIGESEETARRAQDVLAGPHLAEISVTLATREARSLSTRDVVDILEAERAQIFGAQIEYALEQNSVEDFIRSEESPIVVEVRGEHLETLADQARQIMDRLAHAGGFINLRSNLSAGFPVADIRPDKALLADYGLDTEKVAAAVRAQVGPQVASTYQDLESEKDIVLEMHRPNVDIVSTLREIAIARPGGGTVRLGDIAEIVLEPGPREILRRDGDRYISVSADLRGLTLSEGVERARAALADAPFYASITGEEERRAESFRSLSFALVLALVLVYMVMASLFESLLYPFIVMTTAPLALIGVIAAFVLTHQTMNMMAYIGIVMLAGIVVNNGIVLVDAINRQRAEGGQLRPAILEAARRRLRPILMTSLTTVMGLLPMAVGIGEGAELRSAMAIAVIGGMVSSTFLTLLFVPVFYLWMARISDVVVAAITARARRRREERAGA
ncbi:efflux RND transporter permease subunit [bacterium]|nr:efflux RND transporter permease subunit [bacterium]